MEKLHCCLSGNGGSKSTGYKVGLHQASTWGQVSRQGFCKSFVYYLKAVALLCVVMGEEENEEEESERRCLRWMRGWLCSCGRLA